MVDELVRAHIFVEGLVQGVFFRSNTRKKARELNVKGWVKNLPDGRVEAVLEGEKQKVKDLIEWTKRGPSAARVNNVDAKLQEYKGEFKIFEIRYT